MVLDLPGFYYDAERRAHFRIPAGGVPAGIAVPEAVRDAAARRSAARSARREAGSTRRGRRGGGVPRDPPPALDAVPGGQRPVCGILGHVVARELGTPAAGVGGVGTRRSGGGGGPPLRTRLAGTVVGALRAESPPGLRTSGSGAWTPTRDWSFDVGVLGGALVSAVGGQSVDVWAPGWDRRALVQGFQPSGHVYTSLRAVGPRESEGSDAAGWCATTGWDLRRSRSALMVVEVVGTATAEGEGVGAGRGAVLDGEPGEILYDCSWSCAWRGDSWAVAVAGGAGVKVWDVGRMMVGSEAASWGRWGARTDALCCDWCGDGGGRSVVVVGLKDGGMAEVDVRARRAGQGADVPCSGALRAERADGYRPSPQVRRVHALDHLVVVKFMDRARPEECACHTVLWDRRMHRAVLEYGGAPSREGSPPGQGLSSLLQVRGSVPVARPAVDHAQSLLAVPHRCERPGLGAGLVRIYDLRTGARIREVDVVRRSHFPGGTATLTFLPPSRGAGGALRLVAGTMLGPVVFCALSEARAP